VAATSKGEQLTAILNPFSFKKIYLQKHLVLIGKTITHIGVDMKSIREEDVFVKQDSIRLFLPSAQVLDVIINPSDTEVFIEEGTWNDVAVASMKRKIQDKAMLSVRTKGLLQESERRAKEVLYQFFASAGYEKVVIDFKRTKSLE
jgi:hypothetical protein